MLKYTFAGILLLHGLVQATGFTRAFGWGSFTQFSKDISRPAGLLWLTAAALFILCAIIYLAGKINWAFIALAAVILSQALIFFQWQDAKWGTPVNAFVLFAGIAAIATQQFEKTYRSSVLEGLQRTNSLNNDMLQQTDIASLPALVQKYLLQAGVVGRQKVHNLHLVFNGHMRSRKMDWFRFRSEQYNFIDIPTRLFFMKATMFGIPVPGFHAYRNGIATMRVKLFGLYAVADYKGDMLNKAETVTLLNDICLFAPAALIDKRFQWEPADILSIKIIFTVNNITVSAILYFNEAGELTNFVSDDRCDINDSASYRFSTPVDKYQNIDGLHLPGYGETIWHYPEGPFCYGKFDLQSISYNSRQMIEN